MRKRFKLPVFSNASAKDPRIIARAVLGLLLFANMIAAFMVFRPLGGSAEDLENQLVVMRQQMQQKGAQLQRTRALVAKIEQARSSGDVFLDTYFMSRRTASSTILTELDRAAKDAGIRPKDRAFVIDPIEGSDDLSMMTITANFEGTYGDLLQFVNRLDQSPRFLMVDTLTATPQQGSANLNVSVKFMTFVRTDPVAAIVPGAA